MLRLKVFKIFSLNSTGLGNATKNIRRRQGRHRESSWSGKRWRKVFIFQLNLLCDRIFFWKLTVSFPQRKWLLTLNIFNWYQKCFWQTKKIVYLIYQANYLSLYVRLFFLLNILSKIWKRGGKVRQGTDKTNENLRKIILL